MQSVSEKPRSQSERGTQNSMEASTHRSARTTRAHKKRQEICLTAGAGRLALLPLLFDPVGALQPDAFEAPAVWDTLNPVPRKPHAVVQAGRSDVHLERFHRLPSKSNSEQIVPQGLRVVYRYICAATDLQITKKKLFSRTLRRCFLPSREWVSTPPWRRTGRR